MKNRDRIELLLLAVLWGASFLVILLGTALATGAITRITWGKRPPCSLPGTDA